MQRDFFKFGDETFVLSSETYRYSGYLDLEPSKRKGVKKKIAAIEGVSPLNVEFLSSLLGFDYDGKDYDRHIRKVLTEIAAIVGDAKGEIRCSISSEAEAHSGEYLEYYSISGGKLYRQPGVIVRGPREVWDETQQTTYDDIS